MTFLRHLVAPPWTRPPFLADCVFRVKPSSAAFVDGRLPLAEMWSSWRLATFIHVSLLACALSFTPPSAVSFATFGNAQTKALIQAWAPRPLSVSSGAVLLPSSADNLKRFVRARILLEDPNTGCCVASSNNGGLCVVLCRFSRAEHSLLLPVRKARGEPRDSVMVSVSMCVSAGALPSSPPSPCLAWQLWHPDLNEIVVFEKLLTWHREHFGSQASPAPRLSGAHLEWPDDRAAWAKVATD